MTAASTSTKLIGKSRQKLHANLVRPPKGARYGGRTKGTPNKVNGDIKEMIVTALSKAGGVNYLVQCAHKQPVAFLGLVGRVLPLTIAGKGEDGAIPISFEWAPAAPTSTIDGAVAKVADEIKQLAIDTDAEPVLEQLEDAAD